MPKAKAKPLKKAVRKKPPKDGPVHERMRQASKPNKRSKKPTEQRMREASRPPRRRTMTDNAQQGNNMSSSAQGAPKPTGDKPQGTEAGKLSQGAPRSDKPQPGKAAIGAPRKKDEDEGQSSSARAAFFGDHPQRSAAVREAAREQRGAGTGENANATRTRSIIDWPPVQMTHAEHVEELLEIAQENEDYNKTVNEEQTAVTNDAMGRIGGAQYPIGDPKLEQESRDQVLADYKKAHDPELRAESLQGEMDARAARDKIQAEKMYGREDEVTPPVREEAAITK